MFMVSSPEKPENSPLYSVHTDLDSFILCNDKFADEPKLEDRYEKNKVEPTNINIMATLDIEENEGETLEQCTESETQSGKNQDCKLQITHHFEIHAHQEEQNIPHHGADPIIQHNDETNTRDENDDNLKTIPYGG